MRDYTKRELEELRDYYNEHERQPVGENVRSKYGEMHDGFEEYLIACGEYEWNSGFLYAVKLAKEGRLL